MAKQEDGIPLQQHNYHLAKLPWKEKKNIYYLSLLAYSENELL